MTPYPNFTLHYIHILKSSVIKMTKFSNLLLSSSYPRKLKQNCWRCQWQRLKSCIASCIIFNIRFFMKFWSWKHYNSSASNCFLVCRCRDTAMRHSSFSNEVLKSTGYLLYNRDSGHSQCVSCTGFGGFWIFLIHICMYVKHRQHLAVKFYSYEE